MCTTTSSPVSGCEDVKFSYHNPNIQSYFDLKGGANPSFSVLEHISFSVPFIYTPPTTALLTEMFGYVPQSLLTWMAQDARYIAQYPQLVSYHPGGPVFSYIPPPPFVNKYPAFLYSATDLTSSTVVSVHSDGCFNPGACPTSPTPGAAVPAITPANTAVPSPALVVQPSNDASTLMNMPTDIDNSPLVLVSVNSNPYPPITTVPANPVHLESAPIKSAPGESAPGESARGELAAGSPVPGKAGGQTPEDEPLNPAETSPEQEVQPANPTASYQPPPQHQALASMILKVIGGSPIVAPNPDINQDTAPNKQPTPVYVVSLAPSASAVVVNGITSPIPEPANAGASPIVTINSQPTTLGTVPVLAINGQNVVAGAPTATIQGVLVSLAPLATAIVVNGRTTPLSPGQTPIITLGSEPVTASPMSQYVLDGRTLVPGAAAITVSGTPISVPTEGNAVIIGGSTIAIPNTAGPVLPEITLGNRVITANSASQFLLGDQTLVPGAPAITITSPANAIAAFRLSPKALTVGSEVFTPNPTAFSIDGTTISAGGPGMTVDGTPIRLGPSGILNIGGSTMSLPVNEVSPTAFTIGAQVFTPNPTAFTIYGTTISAGGPGETVEGTVVRLGPSGLLEIGSSTISLGMDAASPTPTAYTIGNQVFTPNPTGFPIDGTTISAGGPGVTIDGTVVSLGSSGILHMGSSTISLAPSPAYTVGGKIFTPNPTAFSIDGTIISAGGSGVNIDGTLVSLENSGILDIGSSRILLPPTNVYTVGGETFTANPTAFSIDGTIISAGGSGVKIDGTLVSLEASGILDIGSSRILLPPSNVYTVGGETFTPNPTAFPIDGTTISAGGPGVTIDGIVVSLGASEILYIGSSTITLLSGNIDYAGNPIGLATSARLDIADSTIPLTNGDSALMTTAAGPGPGATSSSTLPRSTHSGGEAQISRPRIGRLGIALIIGCVVMLR